ncbi:NRAMP family metal ion transporter [Burkholderia sp. MSMB617WGS]|uniref:NRAMP family metal ion transporter n=2 Tax=Burkholderiaceae TaxID=119060 RepID=A0ABR5T823_9BURK|nr:NRAMP family metal ion transporter [Burkholderia savannae]AOK51109.1 NRAMP family metal ion transporter [Burkholderia sp. MSMB617WGS]KVG37213.1 NRAMP family metal ion transporter [Burkholderia sp. MSMB0265]KVG77838.1 NRAMP family metal ion transporter [Burkholderia sp. MSMB2040]KVG94272.1 NRAMP family metal ion transporter [Burkholderia sp. MSMB2042]KVG97757.1 NRAMP family metal ion transporter [Burkholderia sp. MSMB2041]
MPGSSVPPKSTPPARLRWAALWGPGLLVMLADCDAGNVVTAAQAGVQWGVGPLMLLLGLVPLLYMIQELTVRLGIFTGRGHGELIREHFGAGWAWLSAAGLVVAVLGSLVTEFTGVAGIGEMFGVPRSVSLPAAVALLIAIVMTGSHKRVDKAAIVIGAFELTFFVVAWKAHPQWRGLLSAAARPAAGAPFGYLAAALIGATFNPWMVFYQQAAVADKRLGPDDHRAARAETAVGAVLTQLLTGAVLVAAAATLAGDGASRTLGSVGEISAALETVVGPHAARVLFGAGVLGASMVAAIVCSLSLAWGLGEVAGYERSLDDRPTRAPWFYGIYVAAVAGCAAIVWVAPDLVSLNVAAQVVNAVMLPLVAGLLVALAAIALPPAQRPRGAYLWIVSAVAAAVSVAGIVGAASGVWS